MAESVESISGPKYLVQQKVLCIDSNNANSEDITAPLYEAVIRKSELKHVDPTTRKILPNKRGRGRGRIGTAAVNALDQNNDKIMDRVFLREWCHFVHFSGWNERWDRWVTERDIFHDTTENRTRLPKSKEDTKKRKRKPTTSEVSSEMMHRNFRLITRACELPFTLQTVLCEDRDKITLAVYPPPDLNPGSRKKEKAIKMLHTIPTTFSIVDFMGKYIQAKKLEDLETFANYHRRQRDTSGSSDDGGGKESEVDIILTKEDLKTNKKKRKEFALSLLALVDASLPLFLLYAEERAQFNDVMAQLDTDDDELNNYQTSKRQPSQLYPPEYLLRAFLKVPQLLSEFDLKKNNPTSILLSNEKAQDFARFLSELIVFMQQAPVECLAGHYQAVDAAS